MRIVSLLASATEIVCALDLGGYLVGRSHECDNPPWVQQLPVCSQPAFDVHGSSSEVDAEVRRRLRSGEPLYWIDAKRVEALRPDVLIAQVHCEVCAVTVDNLERFHPDRMAETVVALAAGSVGGIYDDVRRVAGALHCPERAERLVASMQQRIGQVRQQVAARRPPTVVLLEWTDPPYPAGNWAPELAEAANAQLLLSRRDEHSSAIGWSRVLEADPEWLIVAPCGFDLARTRREIPVLEALPGWSHLQAVRQRRVVLADGNRYFNRSGTTIVETVQILAEILHQLPPAAGDPGQAWERYSGG